MLDMGFEADIRKIVETLGMPEKTERQTLMFSATFPEEIQRLAGDFLNDYLFLTVGRVGGTTSDIQQTILDVPENQKREKLTELLSCSGKDAKSKRWILYSTFFFFFFGSSEELRLLIIQKVSFALT